MVRSPATFRALERERARLAAQQPGEGGSHRSARVAPPSVVTGGPHAAAPPLPPPTITVEVEWFITSSGWFGGTSTVDEGTLFVLADPDDPMNGFAPTLASTVIGIISQPWITPLTNDSIWIDDWEDETSSIILFGVPVLTSVACYSDTNYTNSEGQYNLDVGFEMYLLVPSLVSKTPVSDPGALTVIKAPSDHDFNDRMSTLMFLP